MLLLRNIICLIDLHGIYFESHTMNFDLVNSKIVDTDVQKLMINDGGVECEK